jgi:hypothetical protein
MSALSNYLENALANLVLRNTSFTALATTYVSLHTAVGATESTADWAATELTAGAVSYARVAVAAAGWGAPSDGLCSNLAAVAFATAGSAWGTITHFGIWDNGTLGAGNLLFKDALAASRVIGNGDVFTFAIGNLQAGFA